MSDQWWYHLALGHAGISRLVDTLRTHCFHQLGCSKPVNTRLEGVIRVSGKIILDRGHGATATWEATVLPWQDVAVHPIGSWTTSVGRQKHKLYAHTIVDMVTNLNEVVHVDNIKAANVSLYFEYTWFPVHAGPSSWQSASQIPYCKIVCQWMPLPTQDLELICER